MERRLLLVDAFTDEPLSGTATGVVPDAEHLSDAQMAALAREAGGAGTVFCLPGEEHDAGLRFFAPGEGECDPRPHAVLAAHAHHLAGGPGERRVETRSGALDVDVDEDGTWAAADAPPVHRLDLGVDRVADAIGVGAGHLLAELPLATVSTGRTVLLVPVDYLSTLRSVEVGPGALADLCSAVGADALYAFTFDTLAHESTLHARAFGADGAEEPATGDGAGAVSAYLRETGAIDVDTVVCEHGHVLDRPGLVRVRLDDRVWVGGRAAVALDGRATVPDSTDGDDIVEA